MQIAYASDLHLEIASLDPTLLFTSADVLVLAGDICTARHLATNGTLNKRFRDFFDALASHYRHILYVAGNHESYGSRLEDTPSLLRDLPVHLLNNDVITIDNTLFWGGTLWTDLSNPIHAWSAQQQMNDYRVIRLQYSKLRPEHTSLLHKQAIESINSHQPQVVISHHLPSYRSIPSQYQGDPLNPAYATEITPPDSTRLWIHGHAHDPVDYQHLNCRVVSNPRGYFGMEPQADCWKIKLVGW